MERIEPFEKFYQDYEDWFEANRFVYESELQAVKIHIPCTKKGIEIGVGSGRFAAPLGIKYGVEPSIQMEKIAKRRKIMVVRGVAEALPIKDTAFDYALMVTTICFLDNIRLAFREIHRILKPGGNFIIGFIDKNSPIGKKYQKHKKESAFYRIATFYSTEEVVKHLKECGFRNFSFSQTVFRDLCEVDKIEPVKNGHGEGSFVVINAKK